MERAKSWTLILFYNIKYKYYEKQVLFRWLKGTFSLQKPEICNLSDWSLKIPVLHEKWSTQDKQSESELY